MVSSGSVEGLRRRVAALERRLAGSGCLSDAMATTEGDSTPTVTTTTLCERVTAMQSRLAAAMSERRFVTRALAAAPTLTRQLRLDAVSDAIATPPRKRESDDQDDDAPVSVESVVPLSDKTLLPSNRARLLLASAPTIAAIDGSLRRLRASLNAATPTNDANADGWRPTPGAVDAALLNDAETRRHVNADGAERLRVMITGQLEVLRRCEKVDARVAQLVEVHAQAVDWALTQLVEIERKRRKEIANNEDGLA